MAQQLETRTIQVTGAGGHVLTELTPTVERVIITANPDPKTVEVANNLGLIRNFQPYLTAISQVNGALANIDKVLGLKANLDLVARQHNEINSLAAISNDLGTLSSNMTVLKKLVGDIEVVKNVSNDLETLKYLFGIRAAVVNLNEIKNKLENLYSNIRLLETTEENLATLKLIEEHMLAIEVVAQNQVLLKFIETNISTITTLVNNIDKIQEANANVDVFTQIIDIDKSLLMKIQAFETKVSDSETKLVNLLDTVTEQKKKELQEAALKYALQIAEMRESIATFKLDVNEKLQAIKEDILKVKETYIGHQIVNNVTTTETSNSTATINNKETTSNVITSSTDAKHISTITENRYGSTSKDTGGSSVPAPSLPMGDETQGSETLVVSLASKYYEAKEDLTEPKTSKGKVGLEPLKDYYFTITGGTTQEFVVDDKDKEFVTIEKVELTAPEYTSTGVDIKLTPHKEFSKKIKLVEKASKNFGYIDLLSFESNGVLIQ